MSTAASGANGYQRLEEFIANPRKALWTLSIPVLVGTAIQTLYMAVDMIFVGRVGSEAITALSFNLPVLFLAMGITFGLGSGITAVIAQAIGAGNKERSDRAAEHAVLLGLVLSALFTPLGLLYGKPLLGLLGVPAEIMAPAWAYFKVTTLGYFFMIMAVFFRSILSGEGEVKIPVMIQAVGTLLNIALDPLFIFTFGLGVQGAALATVVSQTAVSLALAYLLFFSGRGHVELRLPRFRFRGDILAAIFTVGAPASLSFLVMAVGGGAFNRILVEFSSDAVAALQIGFRLDQVVVLPIIAISYSLVTLVGMYHGARRHDLLRSIVFYANTRSMVIGTVTAVLFYLFAPRLIALFTDSPEILRLGVSYLRTLTFAYPFIALSMNTGRVYQGLGRGTPELILSMLRVLLIALPLSCLFVFWLNLGVEWVWRSMVLASWTSAGVATAWLRVALRGVEVEVAGVGVESG